jgi:hypothetical protein
LSFILNIAIITIINFYWDIRQHYHVWGKNTSVGF